MTVAAIVPGQRVTWIYVPRGGYGFAIGVDAAVIAVYRSTARIRATLRGGERVDRRVSLASIRPKIKVQNA